VRDPGAPSGRQHELALGGRRAVVVEVGGGLRTFSVDGRALLDGYGPDEMCSSGRGQVLIPWPNRIRDGVYELDGRRHRLALTEPERRNAIHGLVRWAAWHAVEQEAGRVVMEHVLHPQPGYPFTLGLEIEYRLGEEGLSVRTSATNLGREACPYGCGAHPYLTVGTETVDTVVLGLPAGTVLRSDERGIPIAREAVGGGLDFDPPRAVGPARLDHAFTDLVRDADGLARVTLGNPDDGTGATLWMDEAYRYAMVFTGDTLPDVARRSLAVEPMTCPPDAFRSGEAVIRLEPGETFTSTWGIAPS
jgi:aldose 1-epimerase